MTSSNFIHIDFDVPISYPHFTNSNTVSTPINHNKSDNNIRHNTFPTSTPKYIPPYSTNSLRKIPSKTLENKKPLKIFFSKFHVTNPNRAGYNKIYEIRRSRCYFFELNDLPLDTNEINLTIHTNDYHVKSSPISYYNTSTTPNDKYRISCMLTHFFSSQRVIPRRIQQKYFNFIRDKLLARKDIIRSRANSHTSRNIHTRTFFNFTYKKYRFYLGLYIPCHHLSPTPGIGPRPSSCAVPAPFVMSKCRRACVMHQHTFFKSNLYHNIRIDNNDTRIINASGVVNSKQSHGNLLHQRWNNRVKKKIYSNRLGISYDSSYHARNVSSVLKHNNTHMYRKRLDNFSPKYSDNDKTKKRQETRFARLCKRIFNKPEHNRRNTTRHQLNTARRYRFLFLPSQYINKPIKHLIYTHGLDYPNYGFVTPYRIDREDKEKKLISSMTFTNPHSQEVYHTVAPYRPFPDMFIPHKYRNIIPKDPIYDNTGNFIIPGSREWFTYMHNLHQSGTIPIPILTGQVTQYEYYAEQAAEHDRIAKIERDKEESSIHIKKNFGTTYLRHIDRTREINRLFNKSEEFDFKMKHFTSDLRQFGSDRDHRAYIDHELKEFNERYKADTYGKRYVLESELSDNTKELERRPNKRNPTMVPNNFFTSQENRYKRRLNPPAEADDSPGAGPSMFNNLRSLHAKYLF